MTLEEAHRRIEEAAATGAQELHLSECQELSDLAPLAGLRSLRKLGLGGCRSISDLAPIAELQNLQVLNLGGCTGVRDLAPLSKLAELRSLDLLLCHQISDLAPLSNLIVLKRLIFIGCIGVSDLEPLAGLQSLEVLDLIGCQLVADISALGKLAALKWLRILKSPREWPFPLIVPTGVPIPDRVPLSLPQNLLSLPALQELIINELADVPREVQSLGKFDNCLTRLRGWVQDKEAGAVNEPEVKVFLLGNGGVGKTQLCRFLSGESYNPAVPTTHGVQLESLPPETPPIEVGVRLNVWDFGGQDIYHGTHTLFLQQRAVFLILWTPEQEALATRAECPPNTRFRPLVYWIDYVRQLAGAESPVVVIQSKCENRHSERPIPQGVLDMMPGIRTLAFSARIQRGAGTLIGALRDAVAELEQKHDPLWLGRGWIAVRDELRRRVQQEQARTLEYREFERLCHTIGGVSSPGVLMWYLHAAGVVFYSPSLFGGKVILDQSWALEAVYTVFDRERTLPFLRGDGSFTRSDLDRLVWGKIRQEEGKEAFSESEQKLFLSMMESCGICFRLRRNTQGETVWVAPEILPPRSAVQDHLAGRLRESDLPNRRIVFCYRFLHEGIVRGFLCAIGGRAHDAAVYWRNGMWLYERKTDAYAVVEARHGCEESMPGSGVIECLVYGDRSEQLVSMLKGVIARLNPSPFGVQESEPYSTSHPNAPLESIRSEPSSSFNFASNAPVPSGARPAVFISYAWPDNTPAGVQRGEVVERLCSRLDQVGFRVMRDCLVIHNGDSIRAFMKNFGSADHVVAVISDKYLRSPNCMFELHSIWQSSNGDPERFRQRVHPLILEDANVGTIDLRLDRADHWLKVKRSLEGRLSDLGAAFGEENYRQFRLISEFAHHVADMLAWLNDVLMPRGFGQICANDFHEVVELLRIKTNLPASSGNRPLG